ncbi:MFS transporter [Chloroflexota bacterium]
MKISNGLTLWVMFASATLTVMAGSMLTPVVNLVRDGLGADPASAGLIITTHALFMALSSPLVGIFIDRIGTRKPFIFGLILYGLSGGSGLFITSYWLLIASRAILGIAVAIIMNSITVIILNLYEGAERNKIMGWRASSNSFGTMIFPLIGGALGSFSWHLPFAVYTVGLPLGLLALITIPETYRDKDRDNREDDSILQIIRDNHVLLAIYGFMFLYTIILFANVVFLPQLLETIGISSPFFISLFFTIAGLSAALTSLMYGKIKSKLSYKAIVLISLALRAFGLIVISQAHSTLLIAMSVVSIGISRGAVGPAIQVWVGELVPISYRGRIISYLTALGYIGQFLSPILFSPVFSVLEYTGVFLVAGGIGVLLFLLFLVFLRK